MAKWILNTKDINWLSGVANKYSKDLVPFYDFLNRYVKGHEPVLTARRNVKTAIKMINDLLKPTSIPTQKDLDAVIKSLEEVNSDFEFWLDQSQESQELSRKLEEFADKADISLDKLISQQKIIQGRTEKIKLEKESLWSKFQDFSPELAAGVKGVGGYLASNLGTVGTLGAKAWGVGRGIVQGIKKRKLMAEHKEFAGAITPGGATPKEYEGILRALTLGNKALWDKNIFGSLNQRDRGRARVAGDLGGVSSGVVSGIAGGVGSVNLVSGLFNFFNSSSGMLKTKWSKELFALLEKGEGRKKIKEEAGSNIWDALTGGAIGGTLAKYLIPIAVFALKGIAVAVAGAIGWGIGRLLGKLWLDKPITELATKGFDWINRKEELKQRKNIDPVTKRTMEIAEENPGMHPAEANKIARAEARVMAGPQAIVKTESVPLVVDTTESTTKNGFEQLKGVFTELKEELKSSNKQSVVGINSGYDAWNIRNPNLDNIVTANADLDQ